METILSLSGICKRFGPVYALKEIDLDVTRGETLALVGENGAGKSTLMKILTGAYHKDAGEIFWEGARAEMKTPADAKKLGIGQVYQRSEIVPELTVAENIFLGERDFARHGLVSWRYFYREAQKLLDRYGIPIDARSPMKRLSVAACQLVAITKVLQRDPKLIIFDEPTAVLSDKEVEILFRLIRTLQEEKRTVIYISHRLEEVFQVSDRIAVMRDGSLVRVLQNENITNEDLIVHMLGRKLDTMFPPKHVVQRNQPVLEVKHLSSDWVHDISFSLYAGEILGIAGLVGSGRTELARALYGMDPIRSGTVTLLGEPVKITAPRDVIRRGMFLAPEDRKGEGLVLTRSIRENITYSNLAAFTRGGIYQMRREREHAERLKEKINIKAPGVESLSGNLSGGNQQKVVLAKALTANPKILIADEPTQGIDVGAKAEIYAILNELARQGMAILMISSEMEEVMGLCSRLLVLRGGRLVGEVGEERIGDSKYILDLMYRSENE